MRVFGIGSTEMLVVAVLALMLFSPRELPKIIRGISQLWGSLRRTADEFRDAILQEESMQELKDAVDGTKAQLRDVEGAARRELMKARMEARRAENKLLRVARERERKERELQAAAMGEGGKPAGEGGKPAAEGSSAPAGAPAGGGTPAAASMGPAGTVSSGGSTPATKPAPSSAPVATSDPAPTSVDPRHATSGKPGGTDGDSSANQGAA